MTPSSLDSVLASAVDLARAAVLEIAPADQVGEHLDVVETGEQMATHSFACLNRGYRGWRWAVTVVRVPDSDVATVSEVVLLPGSDAVLAPAWLPWNERVRPGDLSPGDLYPTDPMDPRLEPGYTGTDALEPADDTSSTAAPLRPEQWELGLGRERVLSSLGRELAVERWWEGDFGPDSSMAKVAPGNCTSCGYLLPIGGLVGQAFGVCANEFGADGRVVALGYGCGAHSSVREIAGTGVPVTEMVVDEYGFESVDRLDAAAVDVAVPLDAEALPDDELAEAAPEADSDDDLVAEPDVEDLDIEDLDVEDLDIIDPDLPDVDDVEPDEFLG